MRELIGHFFGRFFDRESLSPQGEPEINVTQALGFLAAPGGFAALLLHNFRGWDLVSVRCLFLSFSMIVIAFLVVFEWEALFPDKRDYQVLTPLPVSLFTLFLAKVAAFGLFLGLFLVDVNFFSTLLWPAIDVRPGLLQSLGVHFAIVILSGLFAAFSMAAVQGVLITLLPAAAFRRVSLCLQTALMGALVMLLFLSPLLAVRFPGLARHRSPLVYAFPGYWFDGWYELLRPAVRNSFLSHLGSIGAWGLAAATALFVLTYLPGYRRHARKVLEAPQPSPSGPSRLQRTLGAWIDGRILRDPVQIGVFHFITQTLTRSMKHRLFLAAYAGCGGALAVFSVGGGRNALLCLPLTLAFILVSALRAAFNFPSELGANWAFQMSESDDLRAYLAAMRKWILVCAVGPLGALQAGMEFASFPASTALFHLAFGMALALLLMEGMFLGFRKVPFTCAYLPGKINLVFLAVIYVLGFTIYSGVMADLESWLEGRAMAAAGFFAAAAAAYALLGRWRDLQLRAETGLDYQDPGDPVVRTLELSV